MADNLSFSEDYRDFLQQLKERILQAQVRAVLAVNRELVLLYWQIGRDILNRQQQQGWGAKIIDNLAADLRKAFPQMKGFSSRNLKYMRSFAETYPEEQFVQQVVAQIPWGHNLRYALRALNQPIGVSTYQLRETLPDYLQGSLPTIEQWEAELEAIEMEIESGQVL